MPELRFFCPHCVSALKLHHGAPEGKMIKCPRCQAISPFPAESAVAVTPGGAKPTGRGLPTPMPMRASLLKPSAAGEAQDVEPMDIEEAGPVTKMAKPKPKKKGFDGVPWFIALLVLAYAGAAGATYYGLLDDQIKSVFLPR